MMSQDKTLFLSCTSEEDLQVSTEFASAQDRIMYGWPHSEHLKWTQLVMAYARKKWPEMHCVLLQEKYCLGIKYFIC